MLFETRRKGETENCCMSRWKETLTRNTKTYFLCVSLFLVYREIWCHHSLTVEIHVIWDLTPYILVQIYTSTVKMEAVRSAERSVCFFFPLYRTLWTRDLYNLHFKYCLYVRKLWTKNYFANFRNMCGYVMKYSDECICQRSTDSCELYGRAD